MCLQWWRVAPPTAEESFPVDGSFLSLEGCLFLLLRAVIERLEGVLHSRVDGRHLELRCAANHRRCGEKKTGIVRKPNLPIGGPAPANRLVSVRVEDSYPHDISYTTRLSFDWRALGRA